MRTGTPRHAAKPILAPTGTERPQDTPLGPIVAPRASTTQANGCLGDVWMDPVGVEQVGPGLALPP